MSGEIERRKPGGVIQSDAADDRFASEVEVWGERGEIAIRAENEIVNKAYPRSSQERLAAHDRMTQMRLQLAEPDDGVLERMLVRRVVQTWFVLMDAEAQRDEGWRKANEYKILEYLDRRVSKLNSDFLSASKALADVRKKRRPVIQVNMAQQQVNVAGDFTASKAQHGSPGFDAGPPSDDFVDVVEADTPGEMTPEDYEEFKKAFPLPGEPGAERKR